jgi:two-component system phosphate regulon response regulator PhoB
VRLVTTLAAADRLLRSVGEGVEDYVLSSSDGRVSVRVRVSVDGVDDLVQRLRKGRLSVDWSRATVANGSNRVSLSRTELRLLGALLEHPGKAVSRPVLIARTWPRDPVVTPERENALGVYVYTLRKRLAAIGFGDALRTVRGIGYRIVV